MPVNHKKDESRVLAKADFPIDKFPGHYYRGYLWDSLEAMRLATKEEDESENKAIAVCCHEPFIQVIYQNGKLENRCSRRLGEIHFVTNIWSMEIVTHECFHAATNVCKICNINPALNIKMEEFGAYVQGNLTGMVYSWLWNVDPQKGTVGFVWKWRERFRRAQAKIMEIISGKRPDVPDEAQ